MDHAVRPLAPQEPRRHPLEVLVEARAQLEPDELSVARARRRFITAMKRERAARSRHAA